MILLALVMAVSLPVDDLAGPSLRLYDRHADACLESWASDDSLRDDGGPFEGVGLSVMTYGDVGETCSIVNKATARGIQAHPGIRVYVSYPIEHIVSQGHWSEMARQVREASKCADRLSLDVEDYGPRAVVSREYLAAAGIDEKELLRRMRPFLRALRLFDHVGVYPVNVGDVVHAAIVDAAGDSAEIWDESSFGVTADTKRGYASERRVNRAMAHATKAAVTYRSKWPRVLIRAGLYDSYLRTDGHRARVSLPVVVGPLHPWVFRRFRDDSNGRNIGATCSRGWQQSMLYDSRNDLVNAWHAGDPGGLVYDPSRYQRDLRHYKAGGGSLYTVPPASSGDWTLIEAGRRLETLFVGRTDYTLGLTVRIVNQGTERKVIVGNYRDSKSGAGNVWTVTATRASAGGYDLRLHGARFSSPRPLGHVATGEAFRVTVAVGRQAGRLRARVVTGSGAVSVASVPTFNTSWGVLGIQPGAKADGSIELGDQVTLAARAWTDEEMAREAIGTHWPWGRR